MTNPHQSKVSSAKVIENWLFYHFNAPVLFSSSTPIQFIYSFTSIQYPSQAFKHTIEEKMEEVYNRLNKELKMANKELNQKTWSSPDHMARIAGQAHWVRALKHRLERPMEVSPLDYTVIYSFLSWYTPVT